MAGSSHDCSSIPLGTGGMLECLLGLSALHDDGEGSSNLTPAVGLASNFGLWVRVGILVFKGEGELSFSGCGLGFGKDETDELLFRSGSPGASPESALSTTKRLVPPDNSRDSDNEPSWLTIDSVKSEIARGCRMLSPRAGANESESSGNGLSTNDSVEEDSWRLRQLDAWESLIVDSSWDSFDVHASSSPSSSSAKTSKFG
mmetsp:Transcript_12133/g.33623  ORF Transcript_12133/g.33623 Transcript_12133/m.33623 type:complete len:202 (-) Transcript_12133:2447-3052(-)